jgi:hypothetical protein
VLSSSCSHNTLKITTNRQRSVYAGALSDSTILKHLVIAPGTTLTGLYGSQVGKGLAALKMTITDERLKHPEFGLISLGAISETVGRRHT